MGKKTRKTRWRTLPIADESDSEESNALSGSHHPTSKSYHHRPFYSKLSYSSQSTPTRRFQYEPKSTRSSSTASENKITFNEDEYTKITTPRQDVLFKKGYLSKPKNYQTQTSTGNSTASTGNSTGNGTPDHQSADGTEGTDLEYESQFVFPNAFVDQNGIYYINSYEHYPLVVYNPPICYPEYPLSRTKRHSTGSLTESTSPHTEEASQDLSQSGGENTGTGPELNHVYNVIYPGYYYNGICNPNVTSNGQAATEPRKIKKKRRRKVSKTVNQDETTSSEDCYSSDEVITQVENRVQAPKKPLPSSSVDQTIADAVTDAGSNKSNDGTCNIQNAEVETENVRLENDVGDLQRRLEEDKEVVPEEPPSTTEGSPSKDEASVNRISQEEPQSSLPEDRTPIVDQSGSIDQDKDDKNLELERNQEVSDNNQTPTQETIDANQKEVPLQTQINPAHTNHPGNLAKSSKFNLNAEEFIPRAFRTMEHIPLDQNLQFINIHPNFVPLPLINHSLNELNPPPPFNPPFLPPGIPLNFMPADPKMIPNFINFVPNHFVQHPKNFEENRTTQNKVEESKNKNETTEKPKEDVDNVETKEEPKTVEEKQENEVKEVEKVENIEKAKSLAYKTEVDIAKIVSKLEEAAKEQKLCENRRQNYRSPSKFNKTPRQRFNSPYQTDYKQENYRQNYEKRRPRRFETKSNEHPEVKPIEPTPTNRNETTTVKVDGQPQSDLKTKTEPKDTPSAIAKNQEEDRRYSPRHQNYKNINSPRKYINNYNNRLPKNTKTTQDIHQQLSRSAPTTENYSDTLKKPSNYSKSCPRFQKYASNRSTVTTPQNKVPSTIKLDQTEKELLTNKTPILNRTSQWISVSSKKKRKSRSTNEDGTEITNEESDLPTKLEENVPEILELDKIEVIKELLTIPLLESKAEDLESCTKIEDIIEIITKSEATSQIRTTSTNDIPMTEQIQLKDVQDIEKELLRGNIEETTTEQEDAAREVPQTKSNESPPIQTHLKPSSAKETQKKKTKKAGSKNNTKRIIILDPDVSKKEIQKVNKPKEIPKAKVAKVPQETEIAAPKVPEIVPKVEETKNEPLEKETSLESAVLAPLEEPAEILTTPDKKKSKKKKKQNKSNLSTSIPSISSSSTTLNNMDDSYDFLLDTTALVDEKTNVEVSEEFDKMIQKGLFGNLEEKIRSLNVSVDDDFFKSLSLKPRNQSTPEKGFIKATNFTTILNNTNSLPKKSLLDSTDKIDIDFSKIKLPDYEPQPSTSRSGNFLGNVIESETGPPIKDESVEQVSSSKSNGKLKNKSKKNSLISENETVYKSIPKNDETTLQNGESVEILSEKNEGSLLENVHDEKKDEALTQENEQTNNNLESRQNGIGQNDFFRKRSDTIEEDLTPNNEYEIPKDVDNIDNKSDQNKSKDVPIQNVEESTKNDPPKPINGYVFHSGNAKIEISLESLETSNTDNNFLKHGRDLSKKPLEDDQIIIEIQENIIQSNDWKELNQEPDDVAETNNGLSDTESLENSYDMKPLYPITTAVKEWMSKTRETTPEIEILKSPETIYKELIEDNSEDDSDTETSQKNAIGNPSPVDYLDDQEVCHYSTGERVAKIKIANTEDDITICETWSMSQDTSIHDEDLLDCWESDIVETSKKEAPIEKAEDVLELIEKSYGKDDKNEFLRLKGEIEEQKRSGAFPRHADLPYRAICCSLM